MSRSTNSGTHMRDRAGLRSRALLRGGTASSLSIVLTAGVLSAGIGATAGAGSAFAHPNSDASGVTTVAAISPSLTADRGATVPFVEEEAESAKTNGTIIGPDRTWFTLAAEASGRSAVQLNKPGDYVEFTLPEDTNAINVRYSIPDSANGGGITAPLDVTVNGKHKQTMTLTSQYSWLYNLYPFTNDPNAQSIEPDWWMFECGCVPSATTPTPTFATPLRPAHFYDEQRLLLGKTYHQGDTIRLQVPAQTSAAWYAIDLVDFQQVAKPMRQPRHSLSVIAFGADPTGRRDSADAFDRAIAFGRALHMTVYIPPGHYQVNRHIIVDNVTVEGAGNWYSIVFGHQTPITNPDGTAGMTGTGFYGKDASVGGSTNVHLSNFAIVGDVRSRVDNDQVNGVGGAIGGGSTIDGLYIQHTKVGMWFDGPFSGLTIENNEIVDQIADGINLHDGISNVRVTNNFIRNTGDDGLAMWSEINADHNDIFDHNTVQSPTLANDIAIYGGADNAVTDNVVADPVREGSGLQVGSRFNATPFTGTLTFARNTTVRAGILDYNWNLGIGAMWFYALQGSIDADINVTDSSFLDSDYDAVMFVADWGVKDEYVIDNIHFKNIEVDGTGTSVVNARAAGSASFENVDARGVGVPGINDCGTFHFTGTPEFDVQLLGGNDGGWTTPTYCADRPTRVEPPAPSPWVQP